MIQHASKETPLGESVVDEVRAIREALDAEVGHDVEKLAEAARQRSAQIRREFGFKTADLSTPVPRNGVSR